VAKISQVSFRGTIELQKVANKTCSLLFCRNLRVSREKLKPSSSQPKIAIVDDDPEMRKSFSMLISYLRYSASVFESGTSFVQALAKDRLSFDLVLIDYRMPEMNGIEASKIIHRYRPDMKIVLISAFDFVEKEALANGLLYVKKPVSLSTLSKILGQALDIPTLLGGSN
jgi:DNA-binding NtrC family response regulator